MKKITYIIALLSFICAVSSCEDEFLEKPQGSDTSVDSIFSTEKRAMEAISQAYSYALASGITIGRDDRDMGLDWGTLSHLSGEVNAVKYNWEEAWIIQHSGMTADKGSGNALSEDGFNFNYLAIRQCYLVAENIDKVRDLDQPSKNRIKAEMKTLIAYRYQEMFKRYGGVPIVTQALGLEDDIKIPRATLQGLLDHVTGLCDEALPILPDDYTNINKGRVTKGVALAIKAEIYMYAARPLFNTATPYMDMGANNNLICFGAVNPQLWQKAIDASNEVLAWASQHGYGIINTGSPLNDYGTAVATPGNKEVLLAYKDQRLGSQYTPLSESGGANSMSFGMLSQYYKADGTEQIWLALDEERPYSDFNVRIQEMEPRYKVSAMAAGIDAWNNPGSYRWSCANVVNGSTWESRRNNEECGRRVKFWYKADSRDWFEFPIYRLAEFHLNLAEAYNEKGDDVNARKHLNVIRNRAGLPDITETDQDNLRKIIQREWAVEFYEECHRLFDVKHWKHEDIGAGIIGGPKLGFVYTYTSNGHGGHISDYISYALKKRYDGYWSVNQYLSPIPRSEENKGYIIQNPGY